MPANANAPIEAPCPVCDPCNDLPFITLAFSLVDSVLAAQARDPAIFTAFWTLIKMHKASPQQSSSDFLKELAILFYICGRFELIDELNELLPAGIRVILHNDPQDLGMSFDNTHETVRLV